MINDILIGQAEERIGSVFSPCFSQSWKHYIHSFVDTLSHMGNCEDGIQPSLKTGGMDRSIDDHKRA